MRYLRYYPEVEVVPDDEAETIASIRQMMLDLSRRVRDKHGTALKGTHAKAVGLVKAHLQVLPDLPTELAQGVFAGEHVYEALVRFAPGPPEKLSDKASGQRGMAIKLLCISGEHLPESDETTTQDFVLAVDPAFNAATAKSFLRVFRPTAAQSPRLPEAAILAGSRVARGVEAALETVGLESANLKFIGRPPRHPIADAYYSQAPIRFGDHIAKVAAFPSAQTLEHIGDPRIVPEDDDAFRHATQRFFEQHDAAFEIRAQLCTDLATMPVEDSSVAWPEAESPYRPVATLIIPRQQAFSAAREAYFDDRLSFNPVHAITAHRPLGSINRARMEVYKQTAAFRREANGAPAAEPSSLADVPD